MYKGGICFMSKRREAFLSMNAPLKRFTKNVIVKHHGVTEEEFDSMIDNNLIIDANEAICFECYRQWDHSEEECIYCGEEDYVMEKGYFKYNKTL